MNSSQKKETNRDQMLQWVTFKLAGEKYGIEVMQVQEVLRHTEIAPIPGAPLYVIGMINLRGRVVSIIDTRNRFGLPPTDVTEQSRIVVTESRGHVVGMLVDSVAEVVYLKSSEIDTAPTVTNDDSARFIQGVSYKNKELLILIDIDKLLSEDEWAEIESF